jgi:hypothetical protein
MNMLRGLMFVKTFLDFLQSKSPGCQKAGQVSYYFFGLFAVMPYSLAIPDRVK